MRIDYLKIAVSTNRNHVGICKPEGKETRCLKLNFRNDTATDEGESKDVNIQ